MYAPSTVTTAETFLWYRPHPRLSLGIAHLWKQDALRFLANVNAVPQTARTPAINLSAGVQGIGTGNPGFALTAEKDWQGGTVVWNAFVGIGFRSNEAHSHLLGGAKVELAEGFALGAQVDGHSVHPFVTKTFGSYVAGAYLIEAKSPGLLFGYRF